MNMEAAESAVRHVGAAYAVIFVLIMVYAWRLTASCKRLADKVAELERDTKGLPPKR